jgi:hypothetical protein
MLAKYVKSGEFVKVSKVSDDVITVDLPSMFQSCPEPLCRQMKIRRSWPVSQLGSLV